MSGIFYLGRDVTSTADLDRSTPYGGPHRMVYTVALISDMRLTIKLCGSNKICVYNKIRIYMRYAPDNA